MPSSPSGRAAQAGPTISAVQDALRNQRAATESASRSETVEQAERVRALAGKLPVAASEPDWWRKSAIGE